MRAETLIKLHEGVRSHPYHDSVGKVTIGVGRNLTDRGLSPAEITCLFENDMKIAADILDIWCPKWRQFSAAQRAGLLSMAFNLGGPRLTRFVKLRASLLADDFASAAREAKDSKWATQVGPRADEIAHLLTQIKAD